MTTGQLEKLLAASYPHANSKHRTILISIEQLTLVAELHLIGSVFQRQESCNTCSDPIVWVLLGTDIHVQHKISAMTSCR